MTIFRFTFLCTAVLVIASASPQCAQARSAALPPASPTASPAPGGFHFDGTVKLGDLLTVASVAIAGGVFLYTRRKDRKARDKENADRIRAAAGQTLSRLTRAQAIFDSFYDYIQAPITEADEVLVSTRNVIKARDFLWKRCYETKTELVKLYRDEEVEVAYAPLFGYRQDSYRRFSDGLRAAVSSWELYYGNFRDESQDRILGMADDKPFKSADLGNEVRPIASKLRSQQSAQVRECLAELQTFLLEIVAASDEAIGQRLRSENAPVPEQLAPNAELAAMTAAGDVRQDITPRRGGAWTAEYAVCPQCKGVGFYDVETRTKTLRCERCYADFVP
ncbi:MAG: hypothetical protein QOD51_1551 [Candidatus Eremiobacteraeota bacterium]|nr:hypothetical protein [Candidatus Eremiobacteraeota bacterium]